MYAPLSNRSNYSFLEGASDPEELVETAHHLGLRHIALTDRDGVQGIVRAFVKARELGIRLIVGSRLRVADAAILPELRQAERLPPSTSLTLLCTSRAGYAGLCRLVTIGRLRCRKGACIVTWEEVCSHADDLVALWGGREGLLGAEGRNDLVAAVGGRLQAAFGDRLYAMVARHRLADEVRHERRLRQRATELNLPVVAAVEVLYANPARRPLQDVLTCIRHGVRMADAGRLLEPNAEADLKSPHVFSALFHDDPAAVRRTLEVAERCAFSMAEIRYRYPTERLPDGRTSAEHLRHLTLEGARGRYGGEIPADAALQIERELALIEELDYPGYFLTMAEIVRWCRSQDILCQGRGSAANSVVCFCLGITAIDPVRMGLLFERFISRERAEPPDIDLDIAHERREEVIQHVYDSYGRDRAAMVAVVIRYRSRSAVRDVGKALGLAETALDRLAKVVDHYEGPTAETLERAGLDPRLPVHGHLLQLANEILNSPRHLSIHPGGFLLGHAPVHDLVPIENGAMAERTVIQWDKDDVEALGLFKVDLLGLGALSHLDRCFRQIARHGGPQLSMATLPVDDPETYDMICAAETVGVFQIESRAQMSMLPRLRPRRYYDLVIEVSIVRPGPISGGMVHPYLRRRRGEEPVEYPHPSLEPVLKKTLGVPLFQEQVMKLAMVAADYTPGEADQLRRDMAAWRRCGRIEQHRERLVRRMVAKGIAEAFAVRVFEQIRGFGEYGFPESHAASFALISYATAYMRRHYPAAFVCTLLNAQPMGFYSPATLVEDAKRNGVEILPVDVSRSSSDCSLVALTSALTSTKGSSGAPGKKPADTDRLPRAVRMGLRYVKGLAAEEQRAIERARHMNPFGGLADFVRRSGLGEKPLVALAEAGALACFGCGRRQALWQVRGLLRDRQISLPLDRVEVEPEFVPLTGLETVSWDYRRAWHSTSGHPLTHMRAALRAMGLPDAATFARMRDERNVRYAGLVICRQRPGTARGVTFMTLEDETGFVNLVVWPAIFERFAVLARTAHFLGVNGRIQSQQGIVHLIAETLWLPDVMERPVQTASRDFH